MVGGIYFKGKRINTLNFCRVPCIGEQIQCMGGTLRVEKVIFSERKVHLWMNDPNVIVVIIDGYMLLPDKV